MCPTTHQGLDEVHISNSWFIFLGQKTGQDLPIDKPCPVKKCVVVLVFYIAL
jgi:hypothetical protein